jgi:hypothetical protein
MAGASGQCSETGSAESGTSGSNPLSSSGESAANRRRSGQRRLSAAPMVLDGAYRNRLRDFDTGPRKGEHCRQSEGTAAPSSRLPDIKDGQMAACLICHSDAHFRSGGSVKTYECPRCGQYELPGSGGWDTVEIPNQQVPISAWIRQQNRWGLSLSSP